MGQRSVQPRPISSDSPSPSSLDGEAEHDGEDERDRRSWRGNQSSTTLSGRRRWILDALRFMLTWLARPEGEQSIRVIYGQLVTRTDRSAGVVIILDVVADDAAQHAG